MTVPSVTISETDGALGILPPSAGLPMVIIAPASAGTLNTPAAYARSSDVATAFTSGLLVELASLAIDRYGKTVIVMRCDTTTAASITTLDTSGVTGLCVVTDNSSVPVDDYEFVFKVIAGGTVGTAGITYQLSYDGGRSFSKTLALGTATTLSPTGTGVSLSLTTATLVAGDVVYAKCAGPLPDASDLTDSLTALAASAQAWEFVLIGTAIDGTMFDAIDTRIKAMHTAGKHKFAICGFRNQINDFAGTSAETDATYQAAYNTAFGAKSSTSITVCAGTVKALSAVSSRKYRRPFHTVYGPFVASLSEEISPAAVTSAGAIGGVDIRDANGNPDEHDESINPGLDTLRACVARTYNDAIGVFVNRPVQLAPAGSDFDELPERRVMNLARNDMQAYFATRLSEPVRLDRKTGYILESEARSIESTANNRLRSLLTAKPKASSVELVLSRTDNVLSTRTLTGTMRVVPLGRFETINIDAGWNNPALRVA